MKIAFEKWLDENEIPDEAITLFEESIRCYKISAYRSAFIMSYIAFQNILKTRMIKATNTPTGIPTTWWTNICRELGDDDKWDNAVAESVKRCTPDRVFLITGSTVSEYEAYRVIRNKCAHGKTGKIDHYHVEGFWNFVQENYYKFVINGGKAGLLQEIKNHYDRTITAPRTDVSYIIDRIKIGILDVDLYELIKEFYEFCEQDSKIFGYFFSQNNGKIDLWDKIVNESDDRIQNAVIKYIMLEKEHKVCDFVGRYPSTADMFLAESGFARKLWTGLLEDCKYDHEGFWTLLERIIVNGLVPEKEKADFDNLIFKSVGTHFPKEKVDILCQTGYFEKLKKRLFDSSNYDYPNGIVYANSIVIPFVNYINTFGLDKDSVACINQVFSFATFGQFHDAICNMMKKHERLSEYQQIAAENDLNDCSDKFTDTE